MKKYWLKWRMGFGLAAMAFALFFLAGCANSDGSLNGLEGQEYADGLLCIGIGAPGTPSICQEALDLGANINRLAVPLKERYQWAETNPLSYAIGNSGTEIVKLLIDAGADVNYENANDQSMLIYACSFRAWDDIELLLSNGADVTSIDKGNPDCPDYTAIDYAVSSGVYEEETKENIDLLLSYGAKPSGRTLRLLLENAQFKTAKRIYAYMLENDIPTGLSAPLEAALTGEFDRLSELMKETEVSQGDMDLIFFLASAYGDEENLSYLLSKDSSRDVNSEMNWENNMYYYSCSKQTPLSIAAWNGNVENCRFLLAQGADVNQKSEGYHIALSMASASGNEEIVRMFLEAGAELPPASTFVVEMIPLTEAAHFGHVDITEILLDAGYPTDDKTVLSAMDRAACYNQKKILDVYFIRGFSVDLNTDTIDYFSPLESAIENHHFELADYLLDKGADINGGDVKGKGLSWLVRNNNLEGVTYLIEHGADVNQRIKYEDGSMYSPPLYDAISSGYLDMVKLLVENGADTDYDEDGYNALHTAASWGGNYMLRYLLPRTEGIDTQTDGGDTPLMLVVSCGRYREVELMLEYNPDLTIINDEGKTALDIAEEKEYADIAQLLKEHGA